MPDLPAQFTQAKSNVEPNSDDKNNAAVAHEKVRDVLDADEQLKAWGIDTVLIGSYKRQVSIRRVKDVDVLAKLPSLPTDVTPEDLLSHVAKVLRSAFDTDDEKRVKCQDRSIMVKFPDFDLHVDVVPARPAGSYLEIPDKNDDGTIGWKTTNPEELTSLSSALNSDFDGEFVPVVKLVRQARRTHLGRKGKPGGLFFEILTYHAFKKGSLDNTSTASLFTGTLRSVATQLSTVVAGGTIADPTMIGAVISVRATDEQFAEAASTFADLATKAEAALASEDKCWAAKVYRDIFGKNDDDEWVFEMPATCNDDGTARSVAVISAGDRAVPAGDGRFA
ncbi:MAG: nucleotidyltransferase [Actinobacteria bacterium]|nr:nucleotidyltransferase [Actinomycetota bacterium]